MRLFLLKVVAVLAVQAAFVWIFDPPRAFATAFFFVNAAVTWLVCDEVAKMLRRRRATPP